MHLIHVQRQIYFSHLLISRQFFRMCNIFQVCELKKQIRESSSLSTAQDTLRQLVFQKLAVAHHSALQGLQVIETAVELQMIIDNNNFTI